MTTPTPAGAATSLRRTLVNKVPEVTVWFWIIKILCTTVGESVADYINTGLGFGLRGTAVVFTVVLATALAVQFRSRSYVPTIYWLVVVLVSVTGTLYTDVLTDATGVALSVSSTVFAVLLVAVFGFWYAREHTLSIHAINTPAREGFYWLTVLVTFALGTATGDWVLELTGWTPGQSVLLPVALIAVIAVGWRLGANAVLAFWLVYVLTRPLGANLGDFLGRSQDQGGLGVGTLVASLVFLAAIAAIVIYLSRTRADVASSDAGANVPPTSPSRQKVVLAGMIVAALAAGAVVTAAAKANGGRGAALAEAPAPAVALAPGQVAQPLTAADISDVATITADLKVLVQSAAQDQAVSKTRDLESAWDAAASTLQAKNPEVWTALDGKVDAVLTSIRAKAPDQAAEVTAVESLRQALPA